MCANVGTLIWALGSSRVSAITLIASPPKRTFKVREATLESTEAINGCELRPTKHVSKQRRDAN